MNNNFITRLNKYTKERFPVFPAIIFSALFSSVGVLYSTKDYTLIAILSVVIFLFLFRVRLLDEIKDYSFDTQYHSHRPVQRNLISLKEIKFLTILTIILELIIQIFLGKLALTFYLFLFFYHFLMYKNFFIKNFEEKNLFIYILLHQLIFLFYAFYVLVINHANRLEVIALHNADIFLILFLPGYIYEIGRKCKHRISATGEISSDTYIYQWGENKAFLFLMLLLLLQSFTLFALPMRITLPLMIHLTLVLSLFPAFYLEKEKIIQYVDKWSMFLGLLGLILILFL